MRVLVTGATGYIGGRLVPRLLERGHEVRVFVRDKVRVADRAWARDVEVVEGDLLDPDSLGRALDGIDAAYYLVHSMYAGGSFAKLDRDAAHNFVEQGRGLKQVVYLGGILPADTGSAHLSEHLESRAEVGEILRASMPTTELRAGPIIGSGSASFEMVRYLTERLPVMVAPKWVLNHVQPIAIRDVLSYLIGCLGRTDALDVVDIGTEPITFRDMMYTYAEVRGLSRRVIPVPVLAPGLAARWVGLVTPIPNSLAVPLVRGVVRPVVADTARSRQLFPEIQPVSYREAVERAVRRSETYEVETRWSGAVGGVGSYRFEDREGVIREVRTRRVEASTDAVYRTFSGLGGTVGWLVWNWAWGVRGFIDKVVGGPGLRRGRRHPVELLPGETLDFWRVEKAEPPDRLLLRAEMKLPGRAWLQWEAIEDGDATRLVQTAIFVPRGLFGWLYWYGLYPLHARIFSDMASALAARSEAAQA